MTVTAPSKSHVDATLDAVRSALRQRGVDALLVTYPPNVRYLSGFSSPEDASVLVLRDEAVMLTDGRYTAQAEDESLLPFEIVSNAADRVAELAKGLRLGVEAEHLTLKRHRELAEKLGADPQPLEEVVADLRLVKRPDEVELLREAARITDAAFAAVLEFIKPGVSEAEVALELERSMVLAGADRAAFDIIVASGIRGAMPHGTASQKKLAAGELVTMDFGARYRGYHADMTRTVAVGPVGDEERRLYDAVLGAQERGVAAVAPGKTGREVDAVARDFLAEQGLAKHFPHSLGHGTGLQIHEGPRLSQRSDDVLEPGMIVTVEPGVYVLGFTGLRIEDLVLVTEDGHEVLSHSPKELITL